MKTVTPKGYEETTIRNVQNDLGCPFCTYGKIEDLTLKAQLFEDCKEARDNFGKWGVLWFKDVGSGMTYLFDSEEDAVDYIMGDD